MLVSRGHKQSAGLRLMAVRKVTNFCSAYSHAPNHLHPAGKLQLVYSPLFVNPLLVIKSININGFN